MVWVSVGVIVSIMRAHGIGLVLSRRDSTARSHSNHVVLKGNYKGFAVPKGQHD